MLPSFVRPNGLDWTCLATVQPWVFHTYVRKTTSPQKNTSLLNEELSSNSSSNLSWAVLVWGSMGECTYRTLSVSLSLSLSLCMYKFEDVKDVNKFEFYRYMAWVLSTMYHVAWWYAMRVCSSTRLKLKWHYKTHSMTFDVSGKYP